MGQYHQITNLDKVAGLYSREMGSGLKLLEQGGDGYGGPTTGLALLIAPGAPWHGDHLVVGGDYEKEGDLPGVPHAVDPTTNEPYSVFYKYPSEAATVLAKRLAGEAFGIRYNKIGERHIYADTDSDAERIRRLIVNVDDDKAFGPLYVCNLDKQEYLDPREWGAGRNLPAIALRHEGVMAATFILLAICNGRGGGDLHSNHPIIGTWGGDRIVLGTPDENGWVEISDHVKAAITDGEGSYIHEWRRSWVLGSVPEWLEKKAIKA